MGIAIGFNCINILGGKNEKTYLRSCSGVAGCNDGIQRKQCKVRNYFGVGVQRP